MGGDDGRFRVNSTIPSLWQSFLSNRRECSGVGNSLASGADQLLRAKRLFRVGFRGTGEGGDDGGCDYHSNESKADKKIMHWSIPSVGAGLARSELIHTMIMTQVTDSRNPTSTLFQI
jgi:hypothetical protein